MNIQETIGEQAKQLQQISDVCKKYNFVETDFSVTLTANHDQPEITIHCYDSNRETVLVTIGDTFGRDGWQRKVQYGNEAYRWEREIDGVKIGIYDAEVIAKPVERPVAKSDFPLQLADVEEVA